MLCFHNSHRYCDFFAGFKFTFILFFHFLANQKLEQQLLNFDKIFLHKSEAFSSLFADETKIN